MEDTNNKMLKAVVLQKTFDLWTGNWLGSKKRAAHKEAAKEIAANNRLNVLKSKEVYEVNRYDALTGTWKSGGLFLVSDPTIPATDFFDPTLDNGWVIDYSIANIDAEGWTYASDIVRLNKKNIGVSSPGWNSFARRRKWKMSEKKKDETASDKYVHFRIIDTILDMNVNHISILQNS